MYTESHQKKQATDSKCHESWTWNTRKRAVKYAEAILLALSEPVLVLDSSLHVVLANPAFHEEFGVTPEQVKGRPVEELVAAEGSHTQLRQLIESALHGNEKVQDAEIACLTSPESRKILSVSARRLVLDAASSEMVLVELRDITREKESEESIQELNAKLQRHETELEANNAQLQSFTRSVAHDLRSPLRFMNKIAHLIIQDPDAQFSEPAAQRIGMILDSTNQMGKLIDDLLVFSRTGEKPPKKKRVDLTRIADAALKELTSERENRDVTVAIDPLPTCHCDRALIKQVFLNLLSNAHKFTTPREHSDIHVGVEEKSGESFIFVRDNGVGFDMDQVGLMFQPFQRFHRARQFEGTGIGLALARRIIECHGGRIWAESQVNQGATFYFTLGE